MTCFERQEAHCPHIEQVTENNFMHRQAHDKGFSPSLLVYWGSRDNLIYIPLNASNNKQKLYLSSGTAI